MFAAKRYEASKAEADKGKTVQKKPEETPPIPINPLWHHLALSVPGVQTKLKLDQPKAPPASGNPLWSHLALSVPKVQAKLKIGQPGDKYEQEADQVAEQVMRMPEPQVQRTCSAPGCKDEEEKKLLQTKPANAGEAMTQVDHPLIQSVLSSPGKPLDAGTRSFMEPRFGQDFSGVRVHVGGQAVESARAVNARAYTVGRDVVFGEGQYAPGSSEGRRLMAHELTHVVQQQTGLSTSNNGAIYSFAEQDNTRLLHTLAPLKYTKSSALLSLQPNTTTTVQ